MVLFAIRIWFLYSGFEGRWATLQIQWDDWWINRSFFPPPSCCLNYRFKWQENVLEVKCMVHYCFLLFWWFWLPLLSDNNWLKTGHFISSLHIQYIRITAIWYFEDFSYIQSSWQIPLEKGKEWSISTFS